MTKPSLAIACALLVLPCMSPDAHAAATDRNRLPETVNRIERETGGRVLSAERRTRGGREVSRIKVYTPEGRIRILWDDPLRDRDRAPATGESLRERGERRPGYERPDYGRSGMSRTGDRTVVLQRGAGPEPTPLAEPPTRRDDGSPRH